jgi:hypothetical protein
MDSAPLVRRFERAVGELVTGASYDVHVEIPLIVADGDLVTGRIQAADACAGTRAPLTLLANQIYRMANGQITGLLPAGPKLG